MRKRDMYIKPGKYMGMRTKRKRRIPRTIILSITAITAVVFIVLWQFRIIEPDKIIYSLLDRVKQPNIITEDITIQGEGESSKVPFEAKEEEKEEGKDALDKQTELNKHTASDTADQETTINKSVTDKNLGEAGESLGNSAQEASVNSQKPLTEDLINKTSEPVRGIYVSGARAGIDEYMQELISLSENTEVNAMVIDIKNDYGEITYKTELPLAVDIGAGTGYIKDIRRLVKQLKEKDIYLIARIVSFKDPLLAKEREDLSLRDKNSVIFKDKNGDSWVNPYKREVWDYLIDIGKEAAEIGFDEIQFDYIRFSTDAGMKTVNYGAEAKNKSRIDIITEFTKYACDNLKPLGVKVSADVYGTIIRSSVDAEIVGQDYVAMAKYLDFICPMIYPSHYAEGSYGIDYPDMKPYDTILAALKESKLVLEEGNDGEEAGNNATAKVRPWLQDFTASWVKHHADYGQEEIRAQIKAVYDAGYKEWILWNGSNNYTEAALDKTN
jgi:hypothetical protein